jgi:C-terminal processing protease CtpA/Prc
MAHLTFTKTMKGNFFMLLVFLLIAGCDKMLITPYSDYREQNIRDFEETWVFIDENYPFFQFMDIDSKYLYTKYRPLAEQAKGDEIFGVILDMLAELKDGHTMFENKASGISEMIPYLMPRMLKDYNKFSPSVVGRYFDHEMIVSADKTLEYGVLKDNIGYIYLNSFTELQNNPGVFDDALYYLKNTDALLLDVRHNTGGDFYKVAGRFVSSQRKVVFYDKDGQIEEKLINPRGAFIYTEPMVILINGCSVSGAEFIAASLQPLENVTLIGDTTAGLGGSDIAITLTSGKWVSTTRLYSYYYDQLIQWTGIPPDIVIENTEQEIRQNADSQLEFAIEYLKNM